MGAEWGIFNDEGLVEGGFCAEGAAKTAAATRYDPDDDVHVAEICHDHPEHERASCERCDRELYAGHERSAGEDS